MVKYTLEGDKFIINDYLKAKKFSSFLPSISGEDGKPTWVFYANVGQCVGGFGINNKEYPMTPFDSAFLAYSNIPTKSFRTFIQFDNKEIIEPFSINDEPTLVVEKSKISILSSNEYFDIEVTYSTISHKPYPGLLRRVVIKNKGNDHKYRIVDGLPIYLPKGVSNYSYHELTTLSAAYSKVDLNNNAPFYTYTNRGGDEAKVVLKEDGNTFVSFDSFNKRLNAIVDPKIVFNYDDSFSSPLGFENCFNVNKQILSNQIPCAFIAKEIALKAQETYSFISFFSSFDSIKEYNDELKNLNFESLNKEFDITDELVNSLLPTIKTSNRVLDEYIKQCFLDNGLRGGFPITKGDKTIYLYSRKHGDMERDYNSFNIPSSYYSSGSGNYRDINQNRRNDLYLNPDIKDMNIYLFASLIEANGFNPLLVDTTLLKNEYKSYEEATKAIEDLYSSNIKADYIEGYWSDHFDYLLDLIENYLSVYPDKINELLFTPKYKFFDSHIRLKPRRERYVLNNNDIRQYNSLQPINGLSSDWLLDKYGHVISLDLASKLFSLIAIKFSSLDVNQLGLEMYANKPGWNDSCNGLPGLFGSSMNETIELLRLVKFYKRYVLPLAKEIKTLKPLKDLIAKMINTPINGHQYWDIVNSEREKFEELYRGSELTQISNAELINILDVFDSILDKAIERSISLNNGVIPTYFSQKVTKYHLDNGVVIDEFKTHILPNFLEAPARLTKLGKDYFKEDQIKKINESELLDKKLNIYKTSIPLNGESKELGRICSFNAGWLERESDFLHMTFKYLLGLLKSKNYKEFFKACKYNLPCFMNPEIYGRSPLENVSFIVPSNHKNDALHGQGFYARLTGANTEIINMLYLLTLGESPFMFVDGQLTFKLNPHIPLSLFEDKKVTISLFKDVIMTFENMNDRDYDSQKNLEYIVNGKRYKVIPSDIAIKIRNREYKDIKVLIL